MKNDNDLDLIIGNFIEHRKWKTANDRSSQIPVNDGKRVGISHDSAQRVIDTLHELKI